MAKQIINLGNYANDGSGDDLRSAFTKVKANFDELYTTLSTLNGANLGTDPQKAAGGIFSADTNGVMSFKSITGSNGIVVSSTATTVNIAAPVTETVLQTDTNPHLGADLTLNGHNIVGTGDVRTTVWGFDIRVLNTQLQTALGANFNDLGSFSAPSTSSFDLGTF